MRKNCFVSIYIYLYFKVLNFAKEKSRLYQGITKKYVDIYSEICGHL